MAGGRKDNRADGEDKKRADTRTGGQRERAVDLRVRSPGGEAPDGYAVEAAGGYAVGTEGRSGQSGQFLDAFHGGTQSVGVLASGGGKVGLSASAALYQLGGLFH